MVVEYRVNAKLEVDELVTLFEASGIRRPTQERERLQRMIENANLTVTAWDGARLVGVARALTDFSWCCYRNRGKSRFAATFGSRRDGVLPEDWPGSRRQRLDYQANTLMNFQELSTKTLKSHSAISQKTQSSRKTVC